jgi:hypothetical protein
MNVKLLGRLVLVVALAATSAAAAQGAGKSSEASPAKGAAPSKGAMPQNAGVPSTSAGDAIPERVRMSIATFLEGHKWFREYDDGAGKLTKAKIGGPREVGGVFSPKQTVYCVTAELIMTNRNPLLTLWATHSDLQAVVELRPGENGTQRIKGTIYKVGAHSGFAPCGSFKYTPFPELEMVRAKRRHALGRADS